MQPEPGTVVGGRYRLEELLASGGMGSVWRAHHLELDSDVALKLLSPEMLSTPAGERRFRREAQAAARLRSPHIVQVFDYGTFEGQPYLAMELLDGEDLASRLDEQGPLPPDRCLEIIEAVSRALSTAHEAGIVHRDLKPANIFVERAGDEEVVKVVDFGVAKDLRAGAQAAATTGSALVGSPAYMSPEQVWGEAVGAECDVWAMGVVTYEILTGENPFVHEALAQIFDRIVKAKVPSARQKNPRLPEGLDAFFARALARKATDRFESPRELVEALRAALERAPAASLDAAAEKTLAARVLRGVSPRRQRSHVIWGLLALAALLFGASFLLSGRSDTERDAPAGAHASAPQPAVAENAPAGASSAAPLAPPSAATPDSAPAPAARPRVRLPVPLRPDATAPSETPILDPKWGVPVGSKSK